MSIVPLAQGMGGLALALSFALLGPWRLPSTVLLCAAQAALVGIAALAQGHAGLGIVELVEAGLLTRAAHAGWWPAESRDDAPPRRLTMRLAAAAVLAALATLLPGFATALAIVLVGVLLLVSGIGPARQVLGVASMQAGLALAAVAVGLTGWPVVPAALPLLPGAAAFGLWLGQNRQAAARIHASPPAARASAAFCLLALLAAGALPWWVGADPPVWVLDARAAHVALLLCALAAAASWTARDRPPVWGDRAVILGGTVLAVLSGTPLLSWLGMAAASLSAAAAAMPRRAEAWQRLLLACTGLGLALFATIALHAGPALPSAALLALGYGIVALLAPELAIAAVVLVARLHHPPLLLAAGLAALLLASLGLLSRRAPRDTLPLIDLAQGGVALFAFGLDTPAARLAGLLQLTLLALNRCALWLARPDGLDRAAALAGLGGAPPFGLFAGLALVLAATAGQAPWLVLPLGAGLAVVAWSALRQLPAGRALSLSPAWLPLLLALLCGFAMPAPLLAWFRLAAR